MVMGDEAGQGSRAQTVEGLEDGHFADDHLLPSPPCTLIAACSLLFPLRLPGPLPHRLPLLFPSHPFPSQTQWLLSQESPTWVPYQPAT